MGLGRREVRKFQIILGCVILALIISQLVVFYNLLVFKQYSLYAIRELTQEIVQLKQQLNQNNEKHESSIAIESEISFHNETDSPQSFPTELISLNNEKVLETLKTQLVELYNQYTQLEAADSNFKSQFPPYRYKHIAIQARHHSKLSSFLHQLSTFPFTPSPSQSKQLNYLREITDVLEQRLYPFLLQTSSTLLEGYKGKGIVIGVGQKYVTFAEHLILSLREIHSCFLPIEIFCIDREELTDQQKLLFTSYPNVTIKYINEMIHPSYVQVESFAVKPFAILLSSFEQVILLDADVFFIQNPSHLFDDPNYLKSSVIYYNDRTLIGWLPARKAFLEEILPDLRDEVKSTPMYRGYSYHRCEAGVVVYHKTIHFHSLLLACKLNCKEERKVLWSETHGEKEAYWLAMEMIGDFNYQFNKFPVGVIGKKSPRVNFVCGNLLHVDYYGRPLWVNGGLVEDKHSNRTDIIPFDSWALENSIISKWDSHLKCYGESTVQEFTEAESSVIKSLVRIWNRQ